MNDPQFPTFFTKMVDELVEFSEYDNELKDGITWLDKQAQKKNISFYKIVHDVLLRHEINIKAKEWMREREG